MWLTAGLDRRTSPAQGSTACSGGEVGATHVEKSVAGVGVGEERSEEAPGAEAEWVRGSAGATVWRCGVAAAA